MTKQLAMEHNNLVDVLLAEDNVHDAELIIRELRKNGLAENLVHVGDGEEALDFVFGAGKYRKMRNTISPLKLVLLDVKMPRVTGIEVLKKIKEDDRTKTIPVVMLTSSREDPDVRECYQLGANSYIVKPVNFESFAQAIKDLCLYWLLLNQPPVK